MKKSLRVIAIGSIFLLCGASFFGIVSVNNDNISTGFWNIRQIAVTTTHADDDNERGDDDNRRGGGDNEGGDDDRRTNTIPAITPAPVTSTPVTSTPATSTPATTSNNGTTSTVTPTQICTYKDANYNGTASYSESRLGGMANPVTVNVTVSGGKISAINVTTQFTHSNLTRVGDSIIANVIAAQKVSTVSGASGTAIASAIQSAINSAGTCTTNSTPTSTPAPVVTPAPITTLPTPTPVVVTPTPTPTPVVVTPTPTTPSSNVFTGEGKYSYPGGSLTSIVELTVTNGKITAAQWKQFFPSGNGNYTRAMADANLQKLINSSVTTINTISGATGTSNAVQDAINNALAKARTSGTTVTSSSANTNTPTNTNIPTTTSKAPAVDSSFLNDILNSDTTPNGATVTTNTKKNIPKASTVSSSTPTEHTAPNGKIYTIHTLSTGAYVFERPDGSISSKKFTSYQSVIGFINENNQELQDEGTYTTPNGKTYTIINNTTSGVYNFKRPDGSVSGREFATKDALITYLRQNNPIATPVRSIIVQQLTPVAKRTITVQQSTTPVIQTARTPTATVRTPTATVKRSVAPVVTTAAKPTAPSASTTAATQAAAAAAKAKAQAATAAASAKATAAAQAQASAAAAAKVAAQQAAAKAAASAAAAKVNTTTAAS